MSQTQLSSLPVDQLTAFTPREQNASVTEEVTENGSPSGDSSASRISGTQKAAILLTAVGIDAASEILKLLKDTDVERISLEIARLQNVSSQRVEQVLLEYRDMSLAHNFMSEGGPSFAQKALEVALGQARAEDIMLKVQAATEVSAFHLLQTLETGQLADFFATEHPQTIALLLANMSSRKAADILSALNPDLQRESTFRLATMEPLPPDILVDVEEVIRDQMGDLLDTNISASGGVDKVADILNNVGRSVEKAVMEGIRERDANIANSIKNLMFVFDDLVKVGDRDLQRLLVEVDQKDLVVALKGASEELQEKILGNVSERASGVIKEELELLGPVRVSEVEDAQRNILEVAQTLEESGDISLSSRQEELVV